MRRGRLACFSALGLFRRQIGRSSIGPAGFLQRFLVMVPVALQVPRIVMKIAMVVPQITFVVPQGTPILSQVPLVSVQIPLVSCALGRIGIVGERAAILL